MKSWKKLKKNLEKLYNFWPQKLFLFGWLVNLLCVSEILRFALDDNILSG